jgi:hypothetical protein
VISVVKVAAPDTTNKYDMRLGCFTSRNEDGGTILLAVSLVKREDARSFSWVFAKFKESFASAPDVLLTDGDTGMAAAAKSVFPGTRHLLCTWHISQNLLSTRSNFFLLSEAVAPGRTTTTRRGKRSDTRSWMS